MEKKEEEKKEESEKQGAKENVVVVVEKADVKEPLSKEVPSVMQRQFLDTVNLAVA